MVISVPASTQTPRRIAQLSCYVRIIFQITGPNTLRFGADRGELIAQNDQGLQDGIQIALASGASGIFGEWWKGDLWVISNGAAFQCILEIPGGQNSAGDGGGL